ncbi:MAG TPA: tetratricopeptide repeat protein [Pyrinomonadaceae bacterium]|jgi:tetratricopeptide (TPR) repeat protein
MYRKHFFFSLAIVALLLTSALAASAQTGQLRGHVLMVGSDGKEVPAAGAIIDVYRVDVAGKYNTKTDKKGNFVFAGLPFTGDYVIAASAPNARPDALAGVKAGREIDYKLTLQAGDGRRLTEAEAKSMGGSGAPASGGNTSGESAEDRKKREELIAKNEEIKSENAKIEAANSTVTRTAKAGNDELAAKHYDQAIALYDEGLAADPTHPGAPVLLTNKTIALTNRGVDRFNEATKANNAAGLEAARQDWRAAVESGNKAVELMKAQTPPTEAAALQRYNTSKYLALSVRAEAYRLFVPKVDQAQADAGWNAYQEYIAAETDPDKKLKAELKAANMLLDAGASEKALMAFEKVLTGSPDNVDAMLGAGLSLFQSGDKAKFQQAANYLQRFVDKAPDTHPLKASAKESLEYLKSQENIKPEKPASGGRRRG